MSGEPRWGRRGILQLNWVFDEYFVLPEVWEASFRPFDVPARPVLHASTEENLKTVVQLELPVGASCSLAGHPRSTCGSCGRERYQPVVKGRFPRVEMDSTRHAVKTEEHFGSGGASARAVLVSKALYEALRDAKVAGAVFTPVEGAAPR